jgi:hypothetical protein
VLHDDRALSASAFEPYPHTGSVEELDVSSCWYAAAGSSSLADGDALVDGLCFFDALGVGDGLGFGSGAPMHHCVCVTFVSSDL